MFGPFLWVSKDVPTARNLPETELLAIHPPFTGVLVDDDFDTNIPPVVDHYLILALYTVFTTIQFLRDPLAPKKVKPPTVS